MSRSGLQKGYPPGEHREGGPISLIGSYIPSDIGPGKEMHNSSYMRPGDPYR